MSPAKNEDNSFEGNIKYGYDFTWTIAEFSQLKTNVESEIFSLEPMCNSTWKVMLEHDTTFELIRIGIKRIDESAHVVSLTSSFTLCNSKGTPCARRTLKSSFNWKGEFKYCDYAIKPFSTKGVKDDSGFEFRLCNDDIITVKGNIATVPCCKQNAPMDENIKELHRDLAACFKESLYSDVDLVIGDDNVTAHKSILAARSPVFKTMFAAKWKEQCDNKIVITDIEKSVLDQFLKFIYTAETDGCDMQMYMDLYVVADYYNVQSLKETCRCFISTDMSEESVCNILSIADSHTDSDLFEAASKYLCQNFSIVEPTDAWKKFVSCNTALAAKLVCRVATSFTNN